MFKPALVIVTNGFIWGIMTCPAVNYQGSCDLLVCRIRLNLICRNQHHHKDIIIDAKWRIKQCWANHKHARWHDRAKFLLAYYMTQGAKMIKCFQKIKYMNRPVDQSLYKPA